MSMMMTLSKSESLNTENQTTSLHESIELPMQEASTENKTLNIDESESSYLEDFEEISASWTLNVTAVETRMPDVSSLEQGSRVSQTSCDSSGFSSTPGTVTVTSPKQKKCNIAKPVREKYKEKLLKEVENELSRDKINEMIITSLKEGKYKQKIIPIDLWDFGGQKDYYMTHQLFITSRGIFVLVFNGSLDLNKDMPDLSFLPGHFGKSNIAGEIIFNSIQHW
ncbi:unnamed protein product [Mytilus coruscus]|uniref:Uncharacterized protein n=1 Tax=Mytilus coruscus TaxID=42192 RepID=A0A6J8CTN0_MYTCO|nr:unnamed protein product [Mytilus coruscus]